MKNIMKYIAMIIAVFCAVMIWWHWNDQDVSAWIIGFTGWVNHALDLTKETKNEQV